MSETELAAVADGRVFTGRQSIGLKLIDQIGGETEAVDWLEREKGVPKGLPIRDWKLDRSLERLGLFGMSARIAEAFGLPGLANVLDRSQTMSDARLLDGLVSIWQVDGTN
jgi:protease IV